MTWHTVTNIRLGTAELVQAQPEMEKPSFTDSAVVRPHASLQDEDASLHLQTSGELCLHFAEELIGKQRQCQ